MTLLDDILTRLQGMPARELQQLQKEVNQHPRWGKGALWVSNTGPQTQAFYSPADILLYGGSAGGGKSDLGLGLAFTEHQRSLILRRKYTDLDYLIQRAIEINGTKSGFSGSPPPSFNTINGKYIQFGANQFPGDEQNFKGRPFDYKYVDEAVDLTESQIRFHLGWVRSTDPKQRCRMVLGSNPPLDPSGEWIIGFFRPWLDLTHPNPAKPGELRWFVTVQQTDGRSVDVEIPEDELGTDERGRRCADVQGKKHLAQSRTFIPAKLGDNPYLARTDYDAKLDSMPEPFRSAMRDGNFMLAQKDHEDQLIPLEWIIQAQARWKPEGWREFAMTAMGFDPAGGGADPASLVWRHGPWFSETVSVPGKKSDDGSYCAGLIISNRRDNAAIVVDSSGGYAGATLMRLKDNNIPFVAYNGQNKVSSKTNDKKLRFANKRAESWWRFREALDPNQKGGSPLALPPSPKVRADLASPRFRITQNGILIEEKKNIRNRLGRSPNDGDAIVLAWHEGEAAVKRQVIDIAGASADPRARGLPSHAKMRSGPLAKRWWRQ